MSVVSTDGGQHFGPPAAVGPTFEQDPLPGTSFPNATDVALDVDQSGDTVYATWADYHTIDSNHGHGVVTIMKSLDHGPGRDRVVPHHRVLVDPKSVQPIQRR